MHSVECTKNAWLPWFILHWSQCVCGSEGEIRKDGYKDMPGREKVSNFKRKLNFPPCRDQPQSITATGVQFCIDNCWASLVAGFCVRV